MSRLVLIRGLPGSGKSTMAKEQFSGWIHVEADMFFIKDGVYKYDPEKIKEAHEWCQAKAAIYLGREQNVVVSNTFTRLWEMMPYLNMLRLRDSLAIYEATGSYPNVHGVPADVIEKMRARWESL